jgi:hypothetical protein
MTEWSNRQRDADAEWRMLREQAETEPCPELDCPAVAGETCVNLDDRLPLGRLPAHSRRIRAAADAAAEPLVDEPAPVGPESLPEPSDPATGISAPELENPQ